MQETRRKEFGTSTTSKEQGTSARSKEQGAREKKERVEGEFSLEKNEEEKVVFSTHVLFFTSFSRLFMTISSNDHISKL